MELCCNKLNIYYGKKQILKNIDFSVNKGEFICLCGLNGSGKSTLLRELSKQKNVSYMEQNENCAWDTTVYNIIQTGRFAESKGFYSKEDDRIVRESAELLEITELLERNIFSLSGGEFQKVRIARSLCQKPDFLILDEPCGALDFTYQSVLLDFFKNLSKEKNIGILISIHDVNAALRFADKIAFLSRLRENPELETNIISGTKEQVLTQEIVEQTFGKKVQIFDHPVFGVKQLGF